MKTDCSLAVFDVILTMQSSEFTKSLNFGSISFKNYKQMPKNWFFHPPLLTRNTGPCIMNPNANEAIYKPKQRNYWITRAILIEEWDESKNLFQKRQPVPHENHVRAWGPFKNFQDPHATGHVEAQYI